MKKHGGKCLCKKLFWLLPAVIAATYYYFKKVKN